MRDDRYIKIQKSHGRKVEFEKKFQPHNVKNNRPIRISPTFGVNDKRKRLFLTWRYESFVGYLVRGILAVSHDEATGRQTIIRTRRVESFLQRVLQSALSTYV